jgi:hypothetical protein
MIANSAAGRLFEIERCIWSSAKPLVFDTRAGALAAFHRAREYEEVRIKLGNTPLARPDGVFALPLEGYEGRRVVALHGHCWANLTTWLGRDAPARGRPVRTSKAD